MTDWHAPNQQSVGIDPASSPEVVAPQKTAKVDKPVSPPPAETVEPDDSDDSPTRRRRR